MANQNLYAKDVKGNEVFILDVEKGVKGFFCIGCDAQMVQVRSDIANRKQFFRHKPLNVAQPERKCTFSNETYRHQQAILHLMDLKKIKVPNLYKFPFEKGLGGPVKIRDSEYIESTNVRAGLSFYENDLGEVKFGNNELAEEKHLLFRPDVIFFDEYDNPILLIEIVVDHKITIEKLAKIRRIAIDTIAVKVPSDSLENIFKIFHKSTNTHWVFNNEKERFKYPRISTKFAKGLPQTIEIEARLFEESYECKKHELKQIIRSIGKFLGSEHYKTAEGRFRSEISRVKRNTKEDKDRLEEQRVNLEARVREQFVEKEREIEREEEELDEEEREFQRRYDRRRSEIQANYQNEQEYIRAEHSNLEGRYLKKARAVEIEQNDIDERISLIRESRAETEDFETTQGELQNQIESAERDFEQNRERLQAKQRSFRERIEQDKTRLIEKERGICYKISKEISKGDSSRESKLSNGIKKLLEAGKFLHDFDEKERNRERHRRAWQCLNSVAYKDWLH